MVLGQLGPQAGCVHVFSAAVSVALDVIVVALSTGCDGWLSCSSRWWMQQGNLRYQDRSAADEICVTPARGPHLSRWMGDDGPMFYADTVGLPAVLRRIRPTAPSSATTGSRRPWSPA